MIKQIRISTFLYFVLFLLLTGACSPKVYLIDRQTLLEEEAAGEWPNFEKSLIDKAKTQGPTPFSKPDQSANDHRIYNVLNGELGSH